MQAFADEFEDAKRLLEDKNFSKAFVIFEKYAHEGIPLAQFRVSYMYIQGLGVEQNLDKGFEWAKKAATSGHPATQYNLGFCYEHGLGTLTDYVQAFHWYHKAAEQGHKTAIQLRSKFYTTAQHIGNDLYWIKAYAEQGYAIAQFDLAAAYESGNKTPVNFLEAFQWYMKAAKQGHNEAQFNIARKYYVGEGVVEDESLSLSWMTRSATTGYVEAQTILGTWYEIGELVAQSDIQANNWYLEAAKQGHANAQLLLSLQYLKGRGSDQDGPLALMFLTLSLMNGEKDAQVIIDKLLTLLTINELDRSEQLFKEWEIKYPQSIRKQ